MSTDLLALFRAEGIQVREIGNWRAHVRPGTFTPDGIVVHHTGSKGTGEQGLEILRDGRDLGQPDELRGPLCNASPRQDGWLDLISAGRANHAGSGSSHVLAEVRLDIAPTGTAAARGLVDDMTGNGWLYGFEVDNSGAAGDDYPPAQYDTVVRACAALCRHHGWTANRVIGHKEWTRRKVDWSLPMDPLRKNVASRLSKARLVNGVWTVTTLPPVPAAPAKPAVRPQPTPAPQPAPEVDMQVLMRATGQTAVYITDGVTKRWVTDPTELDVLIAAGLVVRNVKQVPAAVLAKIPTVGATP